MHNQDKHPGNLSPDDLIAHALEDYTALPDSFVSNRIVAGTMSRIGNWRQRRLRLRLFTLAGVFGCALIAAAFLRMPVTVQPLPARDSVAVQRPPVIDRVLARPQSTYGSQRRMKPMKRRLDVTAVPPKLEQFPSPLSAQEVALVVSASHIRLTPEQAEQLKPQPVTPLQTPAIKIPPIEVSDLSFAPIDISQ